MTDAVLVIGLGNDLRGDDGAGIEVVRRVRERARAEGIELQAISGEPTALLDAWVGYDAVVLVDTMCSGAPAGTIRRFDASRDALPAELRRSTSTHTVGLAEAIELARTLDRLPASVVVYAVEGRCFEAGAGISAEVRECLPTLIEMLAELPTGRGVGTRP